MTAYDIERYLNIRNAGGASIGPDGERIAFLLDTTGTYQVWALEGPEAWPEQLTFYDERVTFVDWSPTREELAFGMDQGGNEQVQLYRLAGDGSTVFEWTDRPSVKHRWGGWSHDGNRIAYASNRRDEAVFDVYVQERTDSGDDAELVWEADGVYSVVGWSPSDDRLLIHEARSNFDHDIHVLDVAAGDARQVTHSAAETRYQGLNWGPDGDAIYLATDRDADTLYLARLGVSDDDLNVLERGGDWDLENLDLDQETGRFVYSRNVEGYSELTVGELSGPTSYRTLASPTLPEGVSGGIEFGPEGEQYAVTASRRTANANVHVADPIDGTVTRWTAAATAGIPSESFVAPELIHYPTFDDREIPAFYTRPNSGEELLPVIVDIHGGPESQRRPRFHPIAQYYLDRGYAYFEPNVRGSTGYGRPYTHLDDRRKRSDSVRDIEAGVRWLRDQETVDPDRIVAMGSSYGGFMVLAALTEYPGLWAAGVDILGIANLVTFLENTGEWRRALREAEYGSLDEDREFLEAISPINNVDAIEAPLFVAHGANDPRVPVDEAEQIAAAAREQGVPVELLVFEDEGHGFSKLENRIEAYRAIADFLETHV